jgi:acetyl-CoA carboxylase beta subunit
MSERTLLFEEVCSEDFLKFEFGGRSYQDQLYDSISKTNCLAAVKVERVPVNLEASIVEVVWVTHNFGFLGGSLGCAEGEKLTRAFEYGVEHNLPVCVQCRSGGARMQEGTSSLMQMAKVSVAVQALHNKGLPFITVLCDPTYGGVSASYAMQSDVKIAVSSETRIGFAGPAVILNTMCEANQTLFDQQCPPDFQSAEYVYQNGQVDMVLTDSDQPFIEAKVATIAKMLMAKMSSAVYPPSPPNANPAEAPQDYVFNYTNSRLIDRPQTQDLVLNLFDNFVELSGDGKVGRDVCLKGGVASFMGKACVVISTVKGHTPTDMQAANYGMPSPHGYRTALRLMKLAEKFGLPVVTFVDTVGAWPTFECESR